MADEKQKGSPEYEMIKRVLIAVADTSSKVDVLLMERAEDNAKRNGTVAVDEMRALLAKANELGKAAVKNLMDL